MKTGLIISACAHAALLAWGLISFAVKPLEAKPTDALPVDIVSDKQFSEIMKGVKDAKKVEIPKPVVDKIGEQKLVEESKPKVSDKKEVKTVTAEPPPPPPSPAEAKPAEAKPEKEPPKTDPIAEALKKEEARQKQAEAKAKADAKAKAVAEAKAKADEKKKLEQQQPKFDASQIAALLDKRNPQRIASTGAEYNPTPSLGAPSALAVRMSQNELDAMRAKLMQLWSPPAGVQNPEDLVVRVRIRLGRDGRLAAVPAVVGASRGPMSEVARESAIRAVIRGQPYDMLTPANYEIWKEVEITFDPREMFRG